MLLLLFVPRPAAAEEAHKAAEYLEQARKAFKKRHITAQAGEAIKLYAKAIAAGAGYEALWEGARATSDFGAHRMPHSKNRRKSVIFKQGVDWARQATKVRPNGAEGHLFLAINMGLHAQSKTLTKQMVVAGDIRRAAEKAVKLNPAAECGSPLRVLGMYYIRLPKAFGGDDNKGLKLLKKAAKICPNSPGLRNDIAEGLAEVGQVKAAIKQLKWVLAHPPRAPADAAEYLLTKAIALKRLKKLR